MIKKIAFGALVFIVALSSSFIIARQTIAQQAPQGGLGPMGNLLNDQERQALYQVGARWTGNPSAPGQMGQADLERFSEFPVLWAGDAALGYNLQTIVRTTYEAPPDIPVAHSQNSVTLIYGDCTRPAGQESCPVPVAIHIQPACQVTPSQVAPFAKATDKLETVRGQAIMQRFGDGHIQIWTGKTSIVIHATAEPNRTGEVIGALRGIGGSAGITTLTNLAPPDLSACKA